MSSVTAGRRIVAEDNGVDRRSVTTLIAALAFAMVIGGCGPGDRAVAPTPTPTIAAGFARFEGHVTDDRNAPLEGVCVVIASTGDCQPASPRTDSAGRWSIDLPTGAGGGIGWDVTFAKDGYKSEMLRILSSPGAHTIDIKLQRTTP